MQLRQAGDFFPNMKHTLVKTDTRHPITRALDYAFADGLIAPGREQELRTQLEDLVMESAKKFVGFQNVDSLRKALDIILGVLSLALMHSTAGKENLMKWSQLITQKGFKNIIDDVIMVVKYLAQKPSEILLNDHEDSFDGSPRDYLIQFATAFDQKKGQWNGYEKMYDALESKKALCTRALLTQWFIKHLSGSSLVYWLDTHDKEGDIPNINEILNTLLFRHCCGLTTRGHCVLRPRDFLLVYEIYQKDQSAWCKRAKKRYDTLVEKIPEDLRSALMWRDKDWFTRYLQDGPPSISKETKVLDNLGEFFGYHIYNWA